MGIRRPERMRSLSLFILVLGLAFLRPVHANPRLAAPEYTVKAGYLLLFARYVTWPEDAFRGPNAPLVVGVLGRDPFGKVLEETFRGMTVEGRRLSIRRLRRIEEATACHLVFLPRTETARLAECLRLLRDRPILTVGENRRTFRLGAVVHFVREGNRMRYEVDLGAAERAKLRIAAPMLVSARLVHGEKPGAKGSP